MCGSAWVCSLQVRLRLELTERAGCSATCRLFCLDADEAPFFLQRGNALALCLSRIAAGNQCDVVATPMWLSMCKAVWTGVLGWKAEGRGVPRAGCGYQQSKHKRRRKRLDPQHASSQNRRALTLGTKDMKLLLPPHPPPCLKLGILNLQTSMYCIVTDA